MDDSSFPVPHKNFSSEINVNMKTINELPDEVLSYIVSFLSLKDAVDTSMIFRRWRHIWKHPILTKQNLVFDIQNIFGNQCEQLFDEYNVGMFDMNYLMDEIKQEYFVRRVNEYLKLLCGSKVEYLKAAFVFDEELVVG
ncbi:hypothetical protein ACLB2K_053980 [Fragaria x ananassa]